MTKLTVIVITKNEAHNIADCLRSVSFADEMIVFDSGSTDGTPDIAREYTPCVTVTPDWPGDGPQKNRALSQARGEWVLCLDADERLSPLLAEEIQALIQTPFASPFAAFALPYQSTYCGKLIRFGDWRGERHVRLFQRQQARFSEDIVHCRLKVKGPVGALKGAIIHHPFPQLAAMLHKMNDYSTQSAQIHFSRGRKASLFMNMQNIIKKIILAFIIFF